MVVIESPVKGARVSPRPRANLQSDSQGPGNLGLVPVHQLAWPQHLGSFLLLLHHRLGSFPEYANARTVFSPHSPLGRFSGRLCPPFDRECTRQRFGARCASYITSRIGPCRCAGGADHRRRLRLSRVRANVICQVGTTGAIKS